MPIHSRRLGGPSNVGNADVVLYTCPADRTAIVKHIGIVPDSGVAGTWFFGIGGTGPGQRVAALRGDSTNIPDGRRQFLVIRAGESLRAASNGVAFTATVSVHGYELVGVPV